jgi:hypothetical protein
MSNETNLIGVSSPPISPSSSRLSRVQAVFSRQSGSPSPKPRGNIRAAPLGRVRSCEEDPADTISALPAIPRARPPPPPYSARSQNRHSSYIPSLESTSGPGPFHLLECIQSGGFATAWAARDLSTSRVLCFKVTSKKIVSEYKASRLALGRELEAYQRLAACIETPYVMQLHGVFQDDSKVYFAMVSYSVFGGLLLIITILGFDGMRSMGGHSEGRVWSATATVDSSNCGFLSLSKSLHLCFST